MELIVSYEHLGLGGTDGYVILAAEQLQRLVVRDVRDDELIEKWQ